MKYVTVSSCTTSYHFHIAARMTYMYDHLFFPPFPLLFLPPPPPPPSHTHTQGETVYQDVALKALTKEWKYANHYSSAEDEALPPSKPLSRHSIIEGFSNLKKELSILSPLKHPHIITLHGVMLRPLGELWQLGQRLKVRGH